jgi:hypothetical protein
MWEGAHLGVLVGEGECEKTNLEVILPLLGWALWQRRENQSAHDHLRVAEQGWTRALWMAELMMCISLDLV